LDAKLSQSRDTDPVQYVLLVMSEMAMFQQLRLLAITAHQDVTLLTDITRSIVWH
jgi:hypothetical protein